MPDAIASGKTQKIAASRRTIVAAAIVCVCLATALLLGHAGLGRTPGLIRTAEWLRILSAAAFVGAGLILVSRWHLLRDDRSALAGAALIHLGALTVPLTAMAAVITAGQPDSVLRLIARLLTATVTLWLLSRALQGKAGDSPTALLTNNLVMTLTAFSIFVLIAYVAPEFLRLPRTGHIALATIMAMGWIAAAAYAARLHDLRWAPRLAPLLAMKGIVDLFGIGALLGHIEWDLAGTLLNGAVAAWATRLAVRELTLATDTNSANLAQYASALVQARDTMSLNDAWREELTHDARNALAGLRAALHTLQQYDERLDAAMTERLRSAAMGEVGHLEDMIIRGPERTPVDFDIVGAIRSTVETRRASGLEVQVHDFSCEVHGHPGDLATVVQNILVNTQQHASGARARLCVVPAGQKVHLYIADDGPGLSDEHAARIFERGIRGRTSTGSGLGLFVARTLMRQQGGDVELRGHFEGAVFVVTMPAAKGWADKPDPGVPSQRVAPDDSSAPLGATT